MAAVADLPHPERHDLHESERARAGNGVFAKVAFVLDEAEHELRIEPGAGCFVLNCHQEVAACGPVRHFRCETRRHVGQPCQPFAVGREDEMRGGIVADRAMERILHVRRERFLDLISGARRQADEHEQDRAHCRQDSSHRKRVVHRINSAVWRGPAPRFLIWGPRWQRYRAATGIRPCPLSTLARRR